jgi:hypothetical protein
MIIPDPEGRLEHGDDVATGSGPLAGGGPGRQAPGFDHDEMGRFEPAAYRYSFKIRLALPLNSLT